MVQPSGFRPAVPDLFWDRHPRDPVRVPHGFERVVKSSRS